MTSWRFALIVAGLAGAVAGCGGDPSAGAKDGKAVYQAVCVSCHGPDGKPPAQMRTRLGVRDLTDAEFRAKATPALVERQVRAGSKSKLMPSFEGVLDDAQITAVAAFVASPQFLAPP